MNSNDLFEPLLELSAENILKLLDKKVCSFEQIVDIFRMLIDTSAISDMSFLYMLIRNNALFESLSEKNILSSEDLKYLLNIIDTESLIA